LVIGIRRVIFPGRGRALKDLLQRREDPTKSQPAM
jgi:hypothetical protein